MPENGGRAVGGIAVLVAALTSPSKLGFAAKKAVIELPRLRFVKIRRIGIGLS
jgi:hypothetical protein